ncbi:DUF45 domain-containing protein [Anabaena sp. FACHB-1237]|uniref:M48 family metallopeptidase n=1 Tax=Anabaena sp. FACHB-1237 TaxID=2692769 RepID=UPI0016814715|nr:SprT-like domain-containing protein [Anabaena sp. FACHB-1237]MBD2137795.1 DUF45 domain-containing protein [Anabaena sp. FACHB-1237]
MSQVGAKERQTQNRVVQLFQHQLNYRYLGNWQHRLMSWYRQQLKQEIPRLIAKWEKNIGVTVNEWGVKLMKTKWGTCNIEAKRIWLNLELAKKDQQCLEYVVVHEIVHLLERNHGDRFEALMNKFMPNWKLYKDELNRSPLSSY